VTVYFKNKYRLNNAGYSIKVARQSLPHGHYQVGILIRDSKRKKEGLIFTGKEIDI
jgi:hypothetical protein